MTRESPAAALLGAGLRAGMPDARARVTAALRGGVVREAARDLGVPLRTLWRWVAADPALRAALAAGRRCA